MSQQPCVSARICVLRVPEILLLVQPDRPCDGSGLVVARRVFREVAPDFSRWLDRWFSGEWVIRNENDFRITMESEKTPTPSWDELYVLLQQPGASIYSVSNALGIYKKRVMRELSRSEIPPEIKAALKEQAAKRRGSPGSARHLNKAAMALLESGEELTSASLLEKLPSFENRGRAERILRDLHRANPAILCEKVTEPAHETAIGQTRWGRSPWIKVYRLNASNSLPVSSQAEN